MISRDQRHNPAEQFVSNLFAGRKFFELFLDYLTAARFPRKITGSSRARVAQLG